MYSNSFEIDGRFLVDQCGVSKVELLQGKQSAICRQKRECTKRSVAKCKDPMVNAHPTTDMN